MSDATDLTARLADVQRRLLDLPDDAFADKYELLKERDKLRDEATQYAGLIDAERPDQELLKELSGLRSQMKNIERKRIDLVVQAGSGGASSSEMGNLGGVKINKGIDDAFGLPKIKARIGVLKGILTDRGIAIPDPD